jgi:hypothetical protein
MVYDRLFVELQHSSSTSAAVLAVLYDAPVKHSALQPFTLTTSSAAISLPQPHTCLTP